MITFEELNLTDRYEFLSSLPREYSAAAEIGVWEGWYTHHIISRTNMHVFGIDPWCTTKSHPDPHEAKGFSFENIHERDSDGFVWHESRYMATLTKLMQSWPPARGSRWTILRSFSYDAVHFFGPTFDFVYIDGEHSYEAVTKDMKDWWPKIKQGGILAGHDYNDTNQGTIDAVNEFAEQNSLNFKITGTAPEKGDAGAPSWVFIKEKE